LLDAHIRVLLRHGPQAGVTPLTRLSYMYPKPLCIQSKMAGIWHAWACPPGNRKTGP
jgi:hypothetical protein